MYYNPSFYIPSFSTINVPLATKAIYKNKNTSIVMPCPSLLRLRLGGEIIHLNALSSHPHPVFTYPLPKSLFLI